MRRFDLVVWIAGACALAAVICESASAQIAVDAAGRQTFLTRCASCHGTTGHGGEFAPGITGRIPLRSDDELARVLHSGLASSGMPAFPDIDAEARTHLIAYLRTLAAQNGDETPHVTVELEDGSKLSGSALNRSATDLELLDQAKKLRLLRKSPKGRWREVTSDADWPGYNGDTVGYRYSKLNQITPENAQKIAPVWMSRVPGPRELQCTPVVVGGVMYVTTANEVYALDAGSGRQIWRYQRARTPGVGGVGGTGVNRGVAVDGDLVFLATDNAHLLGLNRYTGAIAWDTEMIDWRKNYNGTAAPLVVNHMVVAGIAGGDDGARGFVAAYDETNGKELWRTWTVPSQGEPGSETWTPASLEHPSGATWMTGYYDKETETIIWPVGNPGPDLIGDDRPGDNLYTDSVIALDPKTGARKWHFQFTPHDVHDFDAMAPSALIDTEWQGKPRKLLVQANRNGYLYVLDRTDGKYLFGAPYSKKITWASGLTPEGRPIVTPQMEPTHEGRLVCPWLNGASNWYSSSWNPETKLYYVQTNDKCGVYTRTDMPFQLGHGYMAGSFSGDPADPGVRILRAIDIHTGKAVWEIPQTGDATSWGGVLSTAGGIVFFGADDGTFSAADARTGKLLYTFATNQFPHASPMTYSFDHRQYVAVAAGDEILAFALPE
ncbi:MAG TPA: PQQ-binding-like beta-propeller repeat protein [Acidobacteriaceae bacterium]